MIRKISNYIAIVALVLAIGAYFYNPVVTFEKRVFSPFSDEIGLTGIARSIGFISSTCPIGWTEDKGTDGGLHSQIPICTKGTPQDGGWVVYLDEDGKFNNAIQWGGERVYDASEVPGWQ